MTKLERTTEGKATLLVEKAKIVSKEMGVFFNPVKEFDRTLSVIFLKATGKKKVLDLLAASGARGIRLAKETGAKVTFNEVSKDALKVLKKNLVLNKLTKKSKVLNMEANDCLMSLKGEKFDFIDIDPFGSPMNFVFNCVRRVEKDGVLAVTATDTAPLYGVWKWKCMKKYGAYPIRCIFSHELGIRILAKAVIEMGALWNISLTPVFSHSTQHYYRIYFRQKRSHADDLMKQIGFVHLCEKCKARFSSGFNFMQKCKCGGRLQSAGPLYLGKLWDTEVLAKMAGLAEDGSIKEFLWTLKNEGEIDVPYHFYTQELEKEPRIEVLIKMLQKAGFKAARSHFDGKAFRTNASLEEINETVLKN